MARKILALDQATNTTGFSVWEDGKLVQWGKTDNEGQSIEKISNLVVWLEGVIDILEEDGSEVEVILEDIQLQKDVVTFKILAWLQGALLVYLHARGIKTRVYFSTEWKKTCGVKGRNRSEQKRNAQAYILETYGIKAIQDVCDAICIGVHAKAEDNSVVNWG